MRSKLVQNAFETRSFETPTKRAWTQFVWRKKTPKQSSMIAPPPPPKKKKKKQQQKNKKWVLG